MPSQAKDDRDVAKADRRRFFLAATAHAGARVLSKVASAPLERVKIGLQLGVTGGSLGGTSGAGGAVSSGLGRPPGAERLGTVGLLRDIAFKQGPLAFWRGSAAHVSGAVLGAAARLSILRTSQMHAMPGGDLQYRGFEAYVRRCAAFYGAGATALLVAYPMDVAYTCLAADMGAPRRFRGAFDFARFAVREHGILSLYRGFPLCLMTALPFVVVSTAAHDLLAPRLMRKLGQAPAVDASAVRVPPHLYPWNILVGATAGFVAQSLTYPLDTIRRRWQSSSAGPRDLAPRSSRECLQQLLAEGGWQALYRGFGVNALKLVPELSVLCFAYHQIHYSGYFV